MVRSVKQASQTLTQQDSLHDGFFWQLVRIIQNICNCFFPKSCPFPNLEPLKTPSYTAILSDYQKIFLAETDFDKLRLLRDYVLRQKRKSNFSEVNQVMQRVGTPEKGTPKRKIRKEDIWQKVDLAGYQSIKLMLRDGSVKEIEKALSDDKLRAMVKHLEEMNNSSLEDLLTLLEQDSYSFAFKAVVICSVFEKHTGTCDLTSEDNFFRKAWDAFIEDQDVRIMEYYLKHYPDKTRADDPLLAILKAEDITESDDIKQFICRIVDQMVDDSEETDVDEQYEATPIRLRH